MTTPNHKRELSNQELTSIIVNQMYKTYFTYGTGVFERIYETALAGRLRKLGLSVERQKAIRITDEFIDNEPAFFADLIVEGRVIIEIKSVAELHPLAFTQLRSYLRLSGIRTGLLVNFNCTMLKKNIHRVTNDYNSNKTVAA